MKRYALLALVIAPLLLSGGCRPPLVSTTLAAGILPNDSAGLARWLRDPLAEKPGSLMPQIALTDDEIAALGAYLRSRN